MYLSYYNNLILFLQAKLDRYWSQVNDPRKTSLRSTNFFHRPRSFLGRDQEVLKKLGGWGIVYEIGLIVWIIFGLGYLIMIISNITMSLQKPARKAAKGIKMAEKVMFTRIFQEILVMRSKGSAVSRKLCNTLVQLDEFV